MLRCRYRVETGRRGPGNNSTPRHGLKTAKRVYSAVRPFGRTKGVVSY